MKRLTGRQGPLREAPYEEGRSLREGPVPYGKGQSPGSREVQEAPYGENGPYGKGRSLREGPVLTGRVGVLYGAGSLRREERPLITGKLTGSYGEGFYQNWAGVSACVP